MEEALKRQRERLDGKGTISKSEMSGEGAGNSKSLLTDFNLSATGTGAGVTVGAASSSVNGGGRRAEGETLESAFNELEKEIASIKKNIDAKAPLRESLRKSNHAAEGKEDYTPLRVRKSGEKNKEFSLSVSELDHESVHDMKPRFD